MSHEPEDKVGIEVTSAVVAAGVEALRLSFDTDGGLDDYEDVVMYVFQAMIRALLSRV